MSKISLGKSLACFALAFTAMSCSKSNTQTVTLNFPDWKQLQAATYERQAKYSSPTASATLENAGIISVSVGSRVLPGFPWEHKSSNPNPPTNVTFDVETGSLVQAMAILETSGGVRAYYYGDAKVTQSGALTIDLTNVLNTSDGEGKVIGRYISSIDASGKPVGPTGVFQYRFDIASLRADLADRPAMVVTTGEIFNGWMSATTLPSKALKFSYVDGTPIFQLNTEDNSMISVVSNAKRAARMIVPAGYKNERYSGGYDMRETTRKSYVLGFFGPAADAYAGTVTNGLNLCFESVSTFASAPLIPQLYRELNVSGLTTDAPQSQMVWGGTIGSSLPGLQLIRTARIEAGGIVTTSAPCSDTTHALTQNLTIDTQNLSSDDEFMGIRGPFAKLASGQFTVGAFDSANQKVVVNWSLLPGVQSVLGGVSVFYRSLATASNDDDGIKTMDGYDCQSMRDKSPGFQDFKEIQIPATSSTADITGIASATDAAKLQIIACPRALDGSVYKSAVRVQSSGSGQQGSTFATELRVTSAENLPTVSTFRRAHENGNCIPIHIAATDSSGNPASVQTPNTVTVTTADNNILFSSSETCSAPVVANSFSLTNFSGNRTVYFFDTSAVVRPIDMTVTAHASMNLTPTTYFGREAVSAGGNANLRVNFPSQIYAQNCTPFTITLDDNSADRILRGWNVGSMPVNFDTFAGAFSYYGPSDPNCSGYATYSAYMYNNPVPQNSYHGFVKYNGVAASGSTISLTPTTSSSIVMLPTVVTIQQPGVPAQVRISAPATMANGVCQNIQVQVFDSSGHMTAVPTDLVVSLASTGAGSFKSSCMSDLGANPNITITGGQSTTMGLGFTPSSSFTGSMTLTVSGAGALATSPTQVMVTPAPAVQLFLIPDGQTYNPVTYVIDGSTLSHTALTAYPVTVVPVTADGRIANGLNNTIPYNGSVFLQINSPFGATFADMSTIQPLTFLNGVGAISVRAPLSFVGSSVSLGLGISGDPAIATYAYGNATAIVPGAPMQLAFTTTNVMTTASCVNVQVQLQDSNGSPVNAVAGFGGLNISATNGLLYSSDPSCSGGAGVASGVALSIMMGANASNSALYFRPTSTGPAQITTTSAGGFLGSSLNISVSP